MASILFLTLTEIAKYADGRTILYATDGKMKKVGNVDVNSLTIKGSRQNSNFDPNVSQEGDSVKYPVPDTGGDPVITEQQNEGGLDAGSDDIEIPPVMSASKDGQLHICRELQLVVRLFRNTQDWKRS